MTAEPFDALIAKERARLNERREDIIIRRKELDEQLAVVDREIEAINAYETVKTGAAGKKAPGTRSGRRNNIIELLESHPPGMTRGEILETMNIKGDKSGEQSVSNALKQLKKLGKIKSGNDGKYTTI
jgi:Fe2+ or Zn2+ uptake regulation protein